MTAGSSHSYTSELSPEMARAVAFAIGHGGKIVRHPGGFWGATDFVQHKSPWFATTTIQALVRRGAAAYTNWQEGRGGRFPIEVTVTASSPATGRTE